MSEEFMRLARKEIQAHLDGLEHIFIDCNNDQNLHEKSVQIEKKLYARVLDFFCWFHDNGGPCAFSR